MRSLLLLIAGACRALALHLIAEIFGSDLRRGRRGGRGRWLSGDDQGGEKTGFHPFCTETDHFTETGSGQTWGKLQKRETFSQKKTGCLAGAEGACAEHGRIYPERQAVRGAFTQTFFYLTRC
jgi:hypothetical protein